MPNTRLDRFNSLPARPEHKRSVIAALRRGGEMKVANLVNATRLTRTQVLCALDEMVREGAVAQQVTPLRFSLVRLDDETG